MSIFKKNAEQLAQIQKMQEEHKKTQALIEQVTVKACQSLGDFVLNLALTHDETAKNLLKQFLDSQTKIKDKDVKAYWQETSKQIFTSPSTSTEQA